MIIINDRLEEILKSKEQKPIMRIDVFDTANTVPSNGFFVRYYSGVDNTVPPVRTQFETSVFADFSNGMPAPLANYIGYYHDNLSGLTVGDPWMVSYSGMFYAPVTDSYTFTTRSFGSTRLYVSGVELYESGLWGSLSPSTLSGTYNSGIVELNEGWHDIRVDNGYFGTTLTGVMGNYISAFVNRSGEKPRVLSASSVSPSGSFLNAIELNDIMELSESVDQEGTSINFEVPLVEGEGYDYDILKDSYGYLRPNALIKAYAGYATESGYAQTSGYKVNNDQCSDFVQRFVGHIDSISVSQSADSRTAIVSCTDLTKKLKNKINENFPNKVSYSPDVLNHMDPTDGFMLNSVTPNAYDSWFLIDVIRDLCLQAGIDPIYLTDRLNDIGNYFRLERTITWPYTDFVNKGGVLQRNANPFLFRYEYGRKLYDIVQGVAELIGFRFKFEENGNMNLKDPRRTKRIESFETSGVQSSAVSYSGVWEASYNTDASNRIYYVNAQNIGVTESLVPISTFGLYNFATSQSLIDESSYGLDLKPYDLNKKTPAHVVNFSSSGIGPFDNTSSLVLASKNLADWAYLNSQTAYTITISGSTGPFSDISAIQPLWSNNYSQVYVTADGSILWDQTNRSRITTAPGAWPSSDYHKLTFVCNPSNTSQSDAIYVDDALVGSSTSSYVPTYGLFADSTNTAQTLVVGGNGSTSYKDAAFSGYINYLSLNDYPAIPGTTTTYQTSIDNTASLTVSFSGVGCSIFTGHGENGNLLNAEIRRDSDNAIVFQTGIDQYWPTNKYGVKRLLTNTLAEDEYTVLLYPSGMFKFEAIEYYEKNVFKPEYIFRANEEITTVELELTDEDLRNEVIVAGQQIGKDKFIYSRSIDLDSIANPQAKNFTGDKRTFVLIEPRLQSQRRVDWLSSSLLKRYKDNNRKITLGVVGNPKIQVNDVIGIVSEKIGIDVDSNITVFTSGAYEEGVTDVFYVDGVTSSVTQGQYVSNISVTNLGPIEPWRSYLPPTEVLIEAFISRYGSVFSNYKCLTANGTEPGSYDGISMVPLFLQFSSIIDLDRLWAFIDDTPIHLGGNGPGSFNNYAMSQIDIFSKDPITTWFGSSTLDEATNLMIPGAGVFVHNAGGELWGDITVPTAMEGDIGGGNYYGQNSQGQARIDGSYPLAIWGQGTLSNGTVYNASLYHPSPSDTSLYDVIDGETYPILKIKNGTPAVRIQIASELQQMQTILGFDGGGGGPTIGTETTDGTDDLSFDLPIVSVNVNGTVGDDIKFNVWSSHPIKIECIGSFRKYSQFRYQCRTKNLVDDACFNWTSSETWWNQYYELKGNWGIGVGNLQTTFGGGGNAVNVSFAEEYGINLAGADRYGSNPVYGQFKIEQGPQAGYWHPQIYPWAGGGLPDPSWYHNDVARWGPAQNTSNGCDVYGHGNKGLGGGCPDQCKHHDNWATYYDIRVAELSRTRFLYFKVTSALTGEQVGKVIRVVVGF